MIEIKQCQAVRDTPPHEAKVKDGEGAALLTSFTIAVMAAGYSDGCPSIRTRRISGCPDP